ncbi:MAG: hypothetical protein ACOYD4_01000 [Solirubrobacterales bacterium]
MPRRGRIDPLTQQMVLAGAAGRIAVGAGAFFATRPALRALGFGETGAAGSALAKVLGARDLALGALTMAVRDDRAALRAVTLAAAALDAADTAAFAIAAGDPETRMGGVSGALTAGAATLAGLWAWRRLSSR